MVAIFDLNGTLTDPAGIGEPWDIPDLGCDVLATAIETAMVDTILGDYRDFSDHLRSALELHVARRSLDAERIARSLDRSKRLDPYPDATDALEGLRNAGCLLAVLTNSGANGGRATLEACGLAGYFEEILGVDAVKRFKPHPATYAHALDKLNARPEATFMVASHAWDVTGAQHAGLRGVWIRRGEAVYPEVGLQPEITAPTLLDAAGAIAAAR
jgi:2-haloacid dehalogenase